MTPWRTDWLAGVAISLFEFALTPGSSAMAKRPPPMTAEARTEILNDVRRRLRIDTTKKAGGDNGAGSAR